jgi:hypothetical protein
LLRPLRPLVHGALRPRTLRNTRSESSTASKTLEPARPGSTYVVPESSSPLRSTSFPGRHRGFRPRWSPRTLEPSASGRTMTRRTGAPGCLTDPETDGSTRDPQLPWGSCCIRKTLWRLPVLYSVRYRHTRRSRKFSRAFGPRKTPDTVARAARPFRVTGLSKSYLLGQLSRRCRADFLGSVESPSCSAEAEPHHLSATRSAVCPSRVLANQPTGLNADPCPALGLSYSVPAHFNAAASWIGRRSAAVHWRAK